MALTAELTLPLRAFALEVALEVEGTRAIVGPSGAGKTSLLRAVAGLVRPAGGRIAAGGDVWFDATARIFRRPEERSVGLVFQEYALFPHLSVRANVAYGTRAPVDAFLERFRIAHLADAAPGEALGRRAPACRAGTGARARAEGAAPRRAARRPRRAHEEDRPRRAARLLAALEIPVLLVTHDFEDAAALADEVSVIVDGRIRQSGTPASLVARPADAFVASFTGANLLHGWAEDGSVRLDDGLLVRIADPARGRVTLAVYPWDVTVGVHPPDGSAQNVLHAPIRSIAVIGNRARLTIGPLSAEITADSLARLDLTEGSPAYASFKATATRLVAEASA